MKIIKPYMVALLLLGCAGNEVLGTYNTSGTTFSMGQQTSENEEIDELFNKKKPEEFGAKIIADIAANVIIYRLLPLSVTKWSYHFLFMDFYAGYTMLGWTVLSPKFLTFCKGKLRIGFLDLSIDFWRVIPLTITFITCRKECYKKGKGACIGSFFCVVNSIDFYLMYVQWKYIKIGILDVVSFLKVIFVELKTENGFSMPTCFMFPFFLDNQNGNTYYDKNRASFFWLVFFPKFSLDLFELFNNHDNEQTENDIEK